MQQSWSTVVDFDSITMFNRYRSCESLITGKPLHTYFKQHTSPLYWTNQQFHEVHTDLVGFKKLYCQGKGTIIASLVIPRGEAIYAPAGKFSNKNSDGHYRRPCRKLRASAAIVDSIWKVDEISYFSFKLREIKTGISIHDPRFKYVRGQRVAPDRHPTDFWKKETCSVGIHFYLNFHDAWWHT